MLDYVLGLVGEGPRLLWVGTAGAEDPWRALQIHDRFHGRADVRRLEFFPWPPENLRELVLAQDVILVGGGNTANMLAIWRVQGVDKLLRQAWDNGAVLCGSSAGSICWFEAGITDSFGLQLAELHDGLGFLPGSNCPHYDSEALRRPVYTQAVARGFMPGLAAEDAVALHFVDRELAEAVSARPNGRAFRVEARDGQAVETPLPVRYLGG